MSRGQDLSQTPGVGAGGGGFTPTAWTIEFSRFAALGSGNDVGNVLLGLYDPKKEYVYAAQNVPFGVVGNLSLREAYGGFGGTSVPTYDQNPLIVVNDDVNGEVVLDEGAMIVPSALLGLTVAALTPGVLIAGGPSFMGVTIKPPISFQTNYQSNIISSVLWVLASRQVLA